VTAHSILSRSVIVYQFLTPSGFRTTFVLVFKDKELNAIFRRMSLHSCFSKMFGERIYSLGTDRKRESDSQPPSSICKLQ